MSLPIEEKLKEAGYKQYTAPPGGSASRLWQKTVRDPGDDSIAQYFITVYVADQVIAGHELKGAWAEVDFFLPDERGFTVSIHHLGDDWDLDKAEKFFVETCYAWRCIPDIHNND